MAQVTVLKGAALPHIENLIAVEKARAEAAEAALQANKAPKDLATPAAAGLMSGPDKTSLNNLATAVTELETAILSAGSHLGALSHWIGKRANIPDGWIALDGQLVNRADFPDLWPMVQAGAFPVLSDATWQADPTKRGLFSSGNGTTTFRFPDVNGKYTGSIQGSFMRGDGKVDTSIGQLMRGGIPNIVGQFDPGGNVGGKGPENYTGPFERLAAPTYQSNQGGNSDARPIKFDLSRTDYPLADEILPNAMVSVIIMRVRGGTSVIPAPGSAATLMQNVFNGNQRVNGDVEVTGTLTGKAPGGDAGMLMFGDGVWRDAPLQREYLSPAITPTVLSTGTLVHGLGGRPKLIAFEMHCLSANAGYSPGDVVRQSGMEYSGGTSSHGPTVVLGETSLSYRFGNVPLFVVIKNSGGHMGVDASKWAFHIRAFR